MENKLARRGLAYLSVCRDCDAPYEAMGLDITLPNEQWAMIGSEYDILCGRCIAIRAAKLPGAIAIRAFIEFGERA